MSKTTVPITADHRGFKLKAQLIDWLKGHGFEPKDLGTYSEERCDSIDYATKMAAEIAAHPGEVGVILCGSGNGIAIAANRFKALRAAIAFTPEMARLAREHNDANVLALGADYMDAEKSVACLEAFLNGKFLGGRYAERRDKLDKLGGV